MTKSENTTCPRKLVARGFSQIKMLAKWKAILNALYSLTLHKQWQQTVFRQAVLKNSVIFLWCVYAYINLYTFIADVTIHKKYICLKFYPVQTQGKLNHIRMASAVARVSEAPPEISRGAPHTLLAYYYELQ